MRTRFCRWSMMAPIHRAQTRPTADSPVVSPCGLPAANEVHLWWWRIPPLRESTARARLRSNWVWSQVRPRLARYAGIADADLVIRRSPNGKPLAPQLPAAFSLAHDDDIALLALACDEAIGVDVMGARPFNSARQLARRIFNPHELSLWEVADAATRFDQLRTRFCVIEAVVKALDWRLWAALGGIHVVRAGRIVRVPLKRAQLHVQHGFHDGHAFALASAQVFTSLRHFSGEDGSALELDQKSVG